MMDRDLLKREKRIERAEGKETDRYIFRNLFVDGKDEIILKVLWNFFEAVALKWPSAWNQLRPGHILNRTTGFSALMEFLRPAYLHLRSSDGSIVERAAFSALLQKVDLSEDDFTVENFAPGSSGISKLRKTLLTASDLA